jgi:hypothetical protein
LGTPAVTQNSSETQTSSLSDTEHMSELDEAWALALAEAEANARAAGRKDITAYLALRKANDLSRKIGSDWLLTVFETMAGEANRHGASIQISREDKHRFKVGSATMVGRRLSLQSGVRMLSIEVGWPRTPRDGFIRGGGLACGGINHLGMKSASEQLRLVLNAKGVPGWLGQGKRAEVHEADIKHHISVLLNDSRKHSTRS